jgi:coagulation factor 10
MEELGAGNLERECIEETCDYVEFNEVYDDLKVSDPLWKKFADCKNYVNSKESFFYFDY